MSIFTKDCPVCAASHPVHVVRCGCGYCFDPNKLDGVTQELEVISQEEQLYRDYLAARAAQAEQAMHVAKTVAARDRANTVKAAEALLAEQTAMTARAEMDAQTQRATAVKNRIKVVRAGRRARRAKSPAPVARAAAPVSVHAALAPKPSLATPAPAPAPIVRQVVPVLTVTPVQEIRREPPKPIAVAAPAPKPAPPKPVIVTQPKSAAPVALAPPPRPVAVAKPAPIPVAPITRAAPVVVDKPTPSFRASQATRAAQLNPAPTKSTSLECPNCSAKVAPTVPRCRCGFEMPQFASQIPSLSMSAEDRAAFQAALAPARKDPHR